MTATSVRIKNLSIALEAISRINNEGSGRLYEQLEGLLLIAIDQQKKENNPPGPRPSSKHNLADDEIPF